ncbi:uncharacterized protein TRIADDRAFT_55445 [Trichoplax adhaerens]|uniref:PDZ domain-containing protein n=1 Tax=Trichoplax adhaerens TaxID=10228 RepID=B3RUX2_TRIAD|nr:predicted protein [Trichoplax adhaerens]EDV25392.1 predicted protein [Trichoplax adhaerens]|eukprot:XP_002111425.1 predicted protein [Trichoplax adhaerens]
MWRHPIRSEETYTIINNIKSDSIADREPGLLVGCRILAVNQIHLIGKSLDEAYRTLASSPPENPLILCLAKPLYLRPGLSISTPHRYSFGNRSPPSQITKFLSVQAQRRRVNSCGEEYQRNRHIMEMENNAPSNQNNGNNSRYHDSHSQSTTASGVSGPRKYSPPSDATISERSGYNHASNANQANYPEHPTSYHRHSEVDGSYGPTNSNDNQSNNNKWRGSSAVSQSNFVNNENANTSANSYNVSRGPIGRNVPVPPVRQSGKVARVSIGGSVSRVTVPTLNDRQRSVSATELTKGVVNSASNSNPPTVTTSRTVVTKGPHGNKAVASRSVSTSAIALGSNGQAKTSITVKTGHRHTMNTVVDMPPKVVRQHKQYLPVTGGTTLVKSNEGEINDRASGNIVTTAKNQISINMRKNISSTSNNDSQSGAYGPKQSSGRIVISTSKRTVINKRKSDPNERGQPKVTTNEGSRSATPTPTHDKSKGFALGSGAQPQEEDSSDSLNYPTAWRQNTKTIKLESSRSDEPLGIDVQVIDDPENHGHSCTIVTKLASNSITTRAKVISVYDRLVSINDLSLEDIPSQSADEIIKTAGRGTWKLVMRQVLTNQEKDAKEVKSMDSTRVEETIQAESALVAEGIITLDDNEDKLSEIRRLAVTDPHQIIWSSSTETIDVAKIDNRLGCKIVPKKRPNNPSSNDMIIQNIVSGSSVDRDGRIHPGDLLVAINNVSLEEKSSIETTKLIEESPSEQFIRLTFKKPIDIRGYGQEEKSTYIEDAEPGVAKLPDQLFDTVGAEESLSNLAERSDERSVSTESSKAVTQDSIATPELRIIPDTPQSGTSGDFNTAFANASLQRLHSPSSLPVIINSDAGDRGKSDDPIFIKPKSPAVAAGNQHKVDQPKPHHTETKEVLPSIIEIKDISGRTVTALVSHLNYTNLNFIEKLVNL